MVSADDFGSDTAPSKALKPGDAADPVEAPKSTPEGDEIKAKVAVENVKKAYAGKHKKFYNPYDGTFHMPDGSREFMDESKVEGVNNYHQTHNHAHDQMKMEAKIQAIENINARMMKN